MTLDERRNWKNINIGGLYRCCIANLANTEITKQPELGDEIQCPHCEAVIAWDNTRWKFSYSDKA